MLVLLLRLLSSSGAPDMPLAAAARAATLLAAVELMLFRRVARCAGCIELSEAECECCLGLGRELAILLECLCCVVGRARVTGSYREHHESAPLDMQARLSGACMP